MKRILIILALLQSLTLTAQIRIADFKVVASDNPRTFCTDPDGELCAALKLETKLSGWTFDAGLPGIIDTRYEEGAIWLYVPKSVQKLTVAHKECGVLRDWPIPVSLAAGHTYSMTLVREVPKPVPVRQTVQRTNTINRATEPALRQDAPRSFSRHFLDMTAAIVVERAEEGGFDPSDYYRFGLSYTWLGKRVGPYISGSTNFDGDWAVAAGAAFRLTNPETGAMDWQVYAGPALSASGFGAEIGTRFAWRTKGSVSLLDFGIGCQFYRDQIVPSVSVGLCIWGIPVALGICFAAGCI